MELIALILALVIILSILVVTVWTRSPPLPTSVQVWRVMESLLPETVDGAIYDLGSGWGSLTRRLAVRYPAVPVIGIELSPLPWLVSRVWPVFGATAPRYRFGDFFRHPPVDAGLVVCFLDPAVMARLGPWLGDTLPEGAWVASNYFALPGWHPVAQAVAGDAHRTRVYLYRKG